MSNPVQTFRILAKYAVLGTAQHLGFNHILRAVHRRQLLIVLYHGVISAPQDPLGYTVHVAEFEHQIAILSRWFHPISLRDLTDALEGRGHLPERAVLVTFDDGYRNNLTLAAPILQRYGVPAVIHAATGYLGTDRILWVEEIRLRILHCRRETVPMPSGQLDRLLPATMEERVALAHQVSELCKALADSEKQAYLNRLRELPVSFGEDYVEEAYAFLSWDEVRQLRAEGFAIGSHTVNHPILSALEPEPLGWELAESKRVIEQQLGEECTAFAYPNGRWRDVSDEVIEAVRRAGYKAAFLGIDRFNRDLSAPFTLTRMNILGYLPQGVFHSRISGLVELWR
jgi:peptidoglycan/xylan/chitin deacetylase (PgdA/CDA1 family)